MSISIMLVEDVGVLREMISEMLEFAGYDSVRGFESAIPALQNIEISGPPDLIITDFGLPDMNGMDLIRKVSSRYPGVKFIIFTGSPEIVRDNVCGKFKVIGKNSGQSNAELLSAVKELV